jgi:DNA invertase Pin-like site-specific DNA recombinase
MARISKTQLERLQKKYKTDEAIGNLFGISRQAVHQLRVRYGLVPVRSKYGDRNEQIIDLYNKGVPGTKLARKFKISPTQVYRIINKHKGIVQSEKKRDNEKKPRATKSPKHPSRHTTR